RRDTPRAAAEEVPAKRGHGGGWRPARYRDRARDVAHQAQARAERQPLALDRPVLEPARAQAGCEAQAGRAVAHPVRGRARRRPRPAGPRDHGGVPGPARAPSLTWQHATRATSWSATDTVRAEQPPARPEVGRVARNVVDAPGPRRKGADDGKGKALGD